MEDLIDDDFGDLYAEVEVQASSAINSRVHEPQDSIDWVTYKVNDFPSDSEQLNSVGEKKFGDSAADGSDSEDDLRIVLNDDDDSNEFTVTAARNGNGGRYGEELEDEDDTGFGGGKWKSKGKLDRCCTSGNGGEGGNGMKDGFSNHYRQFKHERIHGPAYTINKIDKESELVASGSAKCGLTGDSGDDRGKQLKVFNSNQLVYSHAMANSLVPYGGCSFSLPWYRTILDVNIDAFEEKRWRHPGVDISDFFNFGFSEDSWKHYCISLEQLRQQSYIHSRNHESSKPNQAYSNRFHSQRVAQGTAAEHLTHVGISSKYEKEERQLGLPRGKAIQVEDSIGERQPTMDIRRPRMRDSDVVIKINVQDSSDSCTKKLGQADCIEHETSKSRDLDVVDAGDVHFPGSSGGDELSEESSERNIESSSLKRSSQTPMESDQMPPDHDTSEKHQTSGADGYNNQKEDAEPLKKIADVIKTVKKTKEEIIRDTSQSNQCPMEWDISLSDRSHFSPSLSCTVSNSELSGGSGSDCTKKSHSPLRGSSSGAELHGLVPKDPDSTKSNSGMRKSGSIDYERNRRPIRKEWEDRNGRVPRVAGWRAQNDDYPISRFHAPFHKSRWIDRLPEFDCHGRDNLSYCRERDLSIGYGDKRFAYNHAQAAYNKHPHSKKPQNYRDGMKSWDLTWNEEYSNGRSFRFGDRDDMDHSGRETHDVRRRISSQDMVHLAKDSRPSKYYNFKDGTTRWRQKSENNCIMKSADPTSRILDHRVGDDLRDEKYGRSASLADWRKDSFDERCERHGPFIDRDLDLYTERVRYMDDSHGDLDDGWFLEFGDEHRHLASRSHRESNATYHGRWQDRMSPKSDICSSRLTEKYGRRERQLCDDDCSYGGWDGNCNDIAYVQNGIMYPDDQVHFRREKYRAPRKDSESFLTHECDEFYAERKSYSYGKTTRHENEVLVDHMLLERHRYKTIREDSVDEINKHHKYRGEHEQIVKRCRYPVDLIVGNGKSLGRYSSHGSSGCNEQKATPKEKAMQTGLSKKEVKQHDKKRLNEVPITEYNEDLDIEEGQVIKEDLIAELNARHVSDNAAQRQNLPRSFSGKDTTTGQYDEQRILDTLAKMEKRRARFKDPVMTKKEPENVPKVQDELMVESVECRQERPSRKRRWGGG